MQKCLLATKFLWFQKEALDMAQAMESASQKSLALQQVNIPDS